ncbi:imidazoleglycerol-phosphate dehydratase HisB [Candidatus Raskinella chloraquaticus]|uniref:Imidazoleglycerol-phosphate dehydratase n=1 Tax=Candidatus Raskinella chloraquaticus TaxID=1951219 RepID=A0A1W9HYT7_9HYPH|nr:MAG: imidazoleglycerol-phosphate dehydratase [Proteobacteria bacterium SG_bin8]
MRQATITRTTKETDIRVEVNLDGAGACEVVTGVGFFDHMLHQLARHGGFDLKITAKGDLHIDDHHTVEDVGIALGQAVRQALGDMRGLTRYGEASVPMDEALTRTAIDVSGRPFLVFNVSFPAAKIGSFDCELVREFFQAFAMNAAITLHIDNVRGSNAHHIAEVTFKSVARALRIAVARDPRLGDTLPTTKGRIGA